MINTISIICLILAGLGKASADTVQFHYENSVFNHLFPKLSSWFDPSKSWVNKHTWFPNSKFLTWLISGPLVFITDCWHSANMIYLVSVSVAIGINLPITTYTLLNIFIVHTIISTTFELFWRLFKR